jgi:hypothetical protein
MAFFEMPLDKLKKADKLPKKNRSRQRRRVENKDQCRDAVPSQRHKQSAALLSFRIGPKPVDDITLGLQSGCEKSLRLLAQQDNELYTSVIYRAVLSA